MFWKNWFGVLVLCGIVLVVLSQSLRAQQTHPDFKVSVEEQELVVKNYDPKKYNLAYFPDAKMSVLKKDGLYYWWVAALPVNRIEDENWATCSFRFVGKNFNSMKPDPSDKEGNPVCVLDVDSTFPSGAIMGSVYYDEKSGKLYAWYQTMDSQNFPEEVLHREQKSPSGELETPYYCSIAAAVSNDFGKTFKKLGEVLSQQMTKKDIISGRAYSVDTTPPAVIKIGEYLYVYYLDQNVESAGIAVARLKITDLDKKPQPWKKYFNGNFVESGVAGRFSVLADGSFPDVIYNGYLQQWMMFHHGTENDAEIFMRTSSDGMNWSKRIQIIKDKPENMNIGPTAMDESDTPTITDNEFYLYYLHSTDGRGPSSWLARRKITLKKK